MSSGRASQPAKSAQVALRSLLGFYVDVTSSPLLARSAPLFAALALGALLAQAGSLPIASFQLEAAYAERVESSERLAVVATELAIFPAESEPRPGSAPLAVPCVPDTPLDGALPPVPSCLMEMSGGMPLVMDDASVGNWTYTVSVRERYPESAPAGARFEVELLLSGASRGRVEIAQWIAEPLALEGARVRFDVGRDAPLSPQFVVLVRPVVAVAGEFDLRAVTNEQLQTVWKGEGGDIDGVQNPTLVGKAGESMRIKIRHDDAGDAPHNLRIRNATGAVVAGPTQTITSQSPRAQLDWTPTTPGTYTYECAFHRPIQSGSIEIT